MLKKQNVKVEESISMAQKVQEQCERRIQELNEKVNAFQTQNAYLASRIDGQEEEKNALKAELKKGADRLSETTRTNQELRQATEKQTDQITGMKTDGQTLKAELEFIKREDVLDEDGRQRPVLIQSSESTLLERLQINDFLFEAQQNRNPVPPLVEKIAQLLELLHTAQCQSDQYLEDLSKSNSLVSGLRQKNMMLFERTQMFESFKTRALLRYVMNLVEANEATEMFLDSLNFGVRELSEMVNLIERSKYQEKVLVVTLAENGLRDDAISALMHLVFSFPYLKLVDLHGNAFSADAIKSVESHLRTMPGTTGVVKTAEGKINVHSGNQLRLCLDFGDQDASKKKQEDPTDFSTMRNLGHPQADDFLASPAGVVQPGLGGQTGFLPAQTSVVGHPAGGGGMPPGGSPSRQMQHGGGDTGYAANRQPPGGPGRRGPGPPGSGGGSDRSPRSTRGVDSPGEAHHFGGAGGPHQQGGVPIGLGGPGEVSRLGAPTQGRGGQQQLPKLGAKASRRKVAAPPPLPGRIPDPKVVDKWQAGAFSDVRPTPAEVRPLRFISPFVRDRPESASSCGSGRGKPSSARSQVSTDRSDRSDPPLTKLPIRGAGAFERSPGEKTPKQEQQRIQECMTNRMMTRSSSCPGIRQEQRRGVSARKMRPVPGG